ncbi:hypothetical protein B0T11DRAFT_84435 [Plectosphaerella cucumerina]|uniref:Uncharacterized protein n=1 Tax=Plectosphaerella cucumerina TaxID=40658 RepID=A0A8K0TFG2_9PEZI|nr:hypothetical protein B0T11DRAFT_84435 [Plectosphaerella cucumerina]
MDSGSPRPVPAAMGSSMLLLQHCTGVSVAFSTTVQRHAPLHFYFTTDNLEHVTCEYLGVARYLVWMRVAGVGQERGRNGQRPSLPRVGDGEDVVTRQPDLVSQDAPARGPRSLLYIWAPAASLAHTQTHSLSFPFNHCLQARRPRPSRVLGGGFSQRIDAVHNVPSIDEAAARVEMAIYEFKNSYDEVSTV